MLSEIIHFWMINMWSEKCEILRETLIKFLEICAPDLTNTGKFLRGGDFSNVLVMEESMMQDHIHIDSGHSHTDAGHTHNDTGHTHPYEDRGSFFEKFILRFRQNFTFLISHITNPKMYTLTSHFSYHVSHFKSLIYIHIFTFYSLYFAVRNVICEAHFTFPRCQMWFVKQTWNVNSNFF